MSSRFDQHTCERFGPLVSARLDGELESTSMAALDEHLAVCADCRQSLQEFGQLNELVFAASSPTKTPVEFTSIDGRHRRGRSDVRPPKTRDQNPSSKAGAPWLVRLGSLAVAASILIAVTLTATPPDSTVIAEQIALPLTELEWINDEQMESQTRLLEMLALELRALKLQLARLEVASESEVDFAAEHKRIEGRLDSLIERFN